MLRCNLQAFVKLVYFMILINLQCFGLEKNIQMQIVMYDNTKSTFNW